MRAFSIGFVIVILLTGCTGIGIAPEMQSDKSSPARLNYVAANPTLHALWGLYEISLNNGEPGIVPMRSADFTANVTRFMQPPISATNLVSIKLDSQSKPDEGYFVVDVTIHHPFPGVNKLSGFDVRGILMTNGSISGMNDPTVLFGGPSDTRLLNPDGYARWWNYTEFTSYNKIFGYTPGNSAPPIQPSAIVNPYKYFAPELDKEAPVGQLDFSNRGFFSTSAGVATRRYEIQFAMDGPRPDFKFQYAIDASWAQPDSSYEPDYPAAAFPPDANCQEAFNVGVIDVGSSAYYISPGESGGEIKLDIEVYDWQAATNPSGVQGEISGLWLESSVLGGSVDLLPIATVLPGSSSVSSIYEVTLGSLNLTKSGEEKLFGTIESTSPDTYKPQVPGGDAFAYPPTHLASYFICKVIILDTTPTEPAIVSDLCARWGKIGETVTGVDITGEKFDMDCAVNLQHGTETIPGSNVQWINATELNVDFDLVGATAAKYDVRVTNPGAVAGVLADSFEVMDPATMPTWPTVQGNSAMTGMNGLYGPCQMLNAPTEKHFFQPNPYGNPLAIVLSSDSAYLSNTGDGGPLPACAVNLADGSIKWDQQFHDDMQNWLNVKGVSRDGAVVIVSESKFNTVYGLDSLDGSMIWQVSGLIPVDAYVTLDLDGNFIVPMSGVGYRSIVPNSGATNWIAPIGDPYYCTPAVGENGVIYCTEGDMYNAQLHSLDPATGLDNWSDNPQIGSFYNGVTVHPNGTILVQGGDIMFCFQDNGHDASISWQQPCTKTFYSSIAVGPSGDIYLIDGSGTLARRNPSDGSVINSSTGWGDGVESRPAVGADGLIYTYTRLYDQNKAYFTCFNPDCSLRWQYEGGGWFTDGMFCSPALDQNGKVYSSYRKLGMVVWYDQ